MGQRTGSNTHPSAPASLATPNPLALHFVFPPELVGLVLPLDGPLELGRDAAPDAGSRPGGSGSFAAIPHATVSRRHAAIGYPIAGQVPSLVDRGGRNGTFVDGEPLEGTLPLFRHAVVRFGDTLAVVDERGDPQHENLALPGRSRAMAALRELLPRAASDGAPLLVTGETGTGKEHLAAEVHRLSGRQGPFIAFNCAELSPHLVESQLFGHERGAFTGATGASEGLFVAADGGTLFLDEVGEIPGDLQAKLLRVLQEGEVRPLGSTRTRRVDVRVVSATNAALLERVGSGDFRRDLYARLSYLELHLPPLRERRLDLLDWVEHFRARWCSERGVALELRLRPPVAERLLLAPWPDNLRGLNRFVHRVLTVSPSPEIGMRTLREAMPELAPDAPAAERSDAPPAPPARPSHGRPSEAELLAVYQSSGQSVRATAKHFGKDRRQIYRWLEQFGIARRGDDGEN